MDEHSKTGDALSHDVDRCGLVSSARLTVVTAIRPHRISKAFELDDSGDLVKLSGGHLEEASIEVVTISSTRELVKVIEGLTPKQAIVHGVSKSDATRILTRKQFERAGSPAGYTTRTNDRFRWPEGGGVLMLDHDPVADEPPLGRDTLVESLRHAAPGLRDAELVWLPSASSCVYHGDTQLRGVEGQRLYILVREAADIERAGKVLQARLWLAGNGRFVVSKSGALLDRTLFDGSVWQPSRLDFAGGAECVTPLRQERGMPVIIPGAVMFIDTRTALPDLDRAEAARLEGLKNIERRKVEREATAAREAWICERMEAMVCTGMAGDEEALARARDRAVEALDGGVLSGGFVIEIDLGGRIEQITVDELLDDPKAYHETLTRDPVEPSYDAGRLVGKLYLKQERPVLHSFAHGGRTYHLQREREMIELLPGQTARAVEQTIDILRKDPRLFDRGDDLVLAERGRLYPLGEDALSNWLGNCVQYRKQTTRGDRTVRLHCDPPKEVARQILAKGQRRNLKPLDAIVTGPVIRMDGSVLDEPGYDHDTHLLLDPIEQEIPKVPQHPTLEEARQALRVLTTPFEGFPFVNAGARGGFLAALVTTVVRPVIPAAPGFAFDAPIQGSGKTLLARCVGALCAGRDPEIWPHTRSRDDEETRKRLFTVLREGAPVLVWDNIQGSLDSASLAAFMTAPALRDRVLGSSASMQIPNRILLLMTGNNFVAERDLARRVITCRIDPMLEAPFAREFELDPLKHVLQHRMAMLGAACTLTRARLAHPVPRAPGKLASFEIWDELVRQTVCWVNTVLAPGDFGDPMDLLRDAQAADPEREALHELLAELKRRFDDTWFTATEVREQAVVPDSRIQAAIVNLSSAEAFQSSRRLGWLLKSIEGRITGGMKLDGRHDAARNSRTYRIEGEGDNEPF